MNGGNGTNILQRKVVNAKTINKKKAHCSLGN